MKIRRKLKTKIQIPLCGYVLLQVYCKWTESGYGTHHYSIAIWISILYSIHGFMIPGNMCMNFSFYIFLRVCVLYQHGLFVHVILSPTCQRNLFNLLSYYEIEYIVFSFFDLFLRNFQLCSYTNSMKIKWWLLFIDQYMLQWIESHFCKVDCARMVHFSFRLPYKLTCITWCSRRCCPSQWSTGSFSSVWRQEPEVTFAIWSGHKICQCQLGYWSSHPCKWRSLEGSKIDDIIFPFVCNKILLA